MWLVAPDGFDVGTGRPRPGDRGMSGRAGEGRSLTGNSTDRPQAHSHRTDVDKARSTWVASDRADGAACHDPRVMTSEPPSPPGLPLGSDGYPAASAVTRRPSGTAE